MILVSGLFPAKPAIRKSGHRIPIEYLQKNGIERDKRYCNLCDENEIGTEQHVVVDCNNKDIKGTNKIKSD